MRDEKLGTEQGEAGEKTRNSWWAESSNLFFASQWKCCPEHLSNAAQSFMLELRLSQTLLTRLASCVVLPLKTFTSSPRSLSSFSHMTDCGFLPSGLLQDSHWPLLKCIKANLCLEYNEASQTTTISPTPTPAQNRFQKFFYMFFYTDMENFWLIFFSIQLLMACFSPAVEATCRCTLPIKSAIFNKDLLISTLLSTADWAKRERETVLAISGQRWKRCLLVRTNDVETCNG